MNYKKQFMLSIFTCLLAVSLSFAAKAPDWISGTSKKYSSTTYLSGVGIGEDLDIARSNARAEISKIFHSKIVQSSEATISETSSTVDKKITSTEESKTESRTKVFTKEILQGTQIADTWYDKKKKTFYALAILDKLKTRASLAQQILETEESIKLQMTVVRESVSPIEKIKALGNALSNWNKRELLVIKKTIVDHSPVKDSFIEFSRDDILKQIDESKKSVVFVVESGKNTGLVTMVSERITKIGFVIVPSIPVQPVPGKAVIKVICSSKTELFERDNPDWIFYNWQANLSFEDGLVPGNIIASTSKHGQTSHISDLAAMDKANAEASDAIAQAVEAQIDQYILGNVTVNAPVE